jgi:hypothetical protein
MGYWIQDTGYMGYRIHSINKYMWFRYDIDNICVYIDIYVPTSGTYRAHSTYNYKTLPWIRYRYCGIFYICSYSHISTLGLLYFSVSPSIGYFTCLSVCLYVCLFVCLSVSAMRRKFYAWVHTVKAYLSLRTELSTLYPAYIVPRRTATSIYKWKTPLLLDIAVRKG